MRASGGRTYARIAECRPYGALSSLDFSPGLRPGLISSAPTGLTQCLNLSSCNVKSEICNHLQSKICNLRSAI